MTRVSGPHGFLDADLCRRFIAPEAFEHLPPDVTELALVEVMDSETGQHSTIFGDAREFRKFLTKMSAARESDGDQGAQQVLTSDLNTVMPIERSGWCSEWLRELEDLGRVADRRERTELGWGGYL